jgi:6-phosphofructokinase 1
MRHFAHRDLSSRRPQEARLGHAQRRAAPNAFDRMLGLRFGAGVVDALARGEFGVVAGSAHGEMCTVPLADVVGKTRGVDPELIRLADMFTPSKMPVKPGAT